MKALIVGGAGFVGSYLIEHLVNDLKWSVAVTKMQNEEIIHENIEVYDLNILNKDEIIVLLNSVKPDYIFHLAAQSSVAVSWKNPSLTIDVNVKGAVNMLDAVRESGCKSRILLIGSGEEYGHINAGETPINENNATRPGNIYAATKVAQNLIGKIYSDAYNMDIIMVRAFNHIGPNQLPTFVVADFCKQVAQIENGLKQPVIKVGNLSAKRDFTDVRDVVKAYSQIIQKGKSGETYNVGSGKAIAIEEVLKMILSMSEADITVEIDENRLRPVDVPIIEADITKLVITTGWQKRIRIEETVAETLNYWRLQINQEK